MLLSQLLMLILLAAEQPAIYGRGSADHHHLTRLQTTPPGRRYPPASEASLPRRPEAANGLTSVISRDASVRTNVIVS